MNKLTVVVITKNEEKDIKKCLSSLNFADEVIIIDNRSNDKTLNIARGFTSKIFSDSFKSFSEQRNFGLEKASNDWVLFVDADEIISKELAQEIQSAISVENQDGYLLKRKDIFFGKKMNGGDLRNVSIVRLGRKGKGTWVGDVHEQWIINGKISMLDNPIIHKSHDNISEFISKINYYSSLRANEIKNNNGSSSFISIIFFPLLKFAYLYIVRLGLTDGIHGFVHAVFMSFYSFLVRAKLYQLKNEK